MRFRKLKIVTCPVAEKDHALSVRQYAHTMHRPQTICVAEAFWALPERHFFALLAHELGHVLAAEAGLESTEKEADQAAEKYFGIKILYKETRYGHRLQTLEPEDVVIVKESYEVGS